MTHRGFSHIGLSTLDLDKTRAALELTEALTQARSTAGRARKRFSRHKFTAAISWLADHLTESFATYGEAMYPCFIDPGDRINGQKPERDSRSDKMGSISTRMTERFGCRHPFASAGMAFAGGTADLALGVCAGGGIGAIGVGFTPAEKIRTIIRRIRAATDAPFNINFITCFDNDAQIRVCAEEKVPVASFHWGHPAAEHLTLLRDAGVSVWEQIGNVEAARRAVGDGVEVIVAQGWEAGGHNYGGLPTMVLVPEILDAVSPAFVLASGGIVDGRGVAAALALGADGVWVGTRLVATREAAVHFEHKRRLVEGKGEQTVRSSIFGPEWPHFNPMRVLRNRVVDEWTDRLSEVSTLRDHLPVIGRTVFLGQETEMRKFNVLLPTADTDGDWEEMPWLAGQGVGLIHEIRPAKDVVETMMGDAKAILKRLSGSL